MGWTVGGNFEDRSCERRVVAGEFARTKPWCEWARDPPPPAVSLVLPLPPVVWPHRESFAHSEIHYYNDMGGWGGAGRIPSTRPRVRDPNHQEELPRENSAIVGNQGRLGRP